ncbi:MAG: hypothetical protein M1822_007355 [Bathelium mastoideum]|nr:MAG: hypothetical protein M1822_007355 [Bathelium mastoideum]
MSTPGQSQQPPNRDSLVTIEEIESLRIVKDEQKNAMIGYLKNAKEKVQNLPEGSADHQHWVGKLKEFNGKLRAQLYKQQQSEHAQQQQSRVAQQGQARTQAPQGQQAQQGQQGQQGQQQASQTTGQQPGQQNQFSAEVVQRARGLQIPLPPEMSQADAQKYVQEQRKQYAQFLSQHENAERLRQQQMQLMEQKRNQGQDTSQETAKVARADDYLRKTKAAIEAFERKQVENRARQQQNQANGGGALPQQARPNQPGQAVNTGAESAMSPTSPAAQQQQQQQNRHNQQPAQHTASQAPPSQQPVAHPNLTQQNNAPRPVLNVQQANQPNQLSQTSPHNQTLNNGPVPTLTHEAAMSAAARSYSASQQQSSQQSQSQSQSQGLSQPSSSQVPLSQASSAQQQQQPPQRQTHTPQSAGAAGAPLHTTLPTAGSSSNNNPNANTSNNNNNNNVRFPIPKTLNTTPAVPVQMGPARPTLGGPVNGAPGMMGQPAMQKQPGYILEGEGDRVLSKKKLDELVRQVTGGGEGPGESLTPEVEEVRSPFHTVLCYCALQFPICLMPISITSLPSPPLLKEEPSPLLLPFSNVMLTDCYYKAVLQMADDFVDSVVTAACRVAKLRPSATLDLRDLQLIVERNYNIRVPGYASDEVRTVRKFQPAPGWTQKMNAVQAAKVMGGKTDI